MKEEKKGEKRREEKRRERENKMTPPLPQRLCVVWVFAFCSVQTRVETFATKKKKEKEERKNRHPYRSLRLINIH